MNSDRVRDEVMDAIYDYRVAPERIGVLRRYRVEVAEELLPRSGASLVTVHGKRGGSPGDPTGNAAMRLAEHPLIKKIDRDIAYWRQQRRWVDDLLPLLTDRERSVLDLYISDIPLTEIKWPCIGRERLREARWVIIEKAAHLWGLV